MITLTLDNAAEVVELFNAQLTKLHRSGVDQAELERPLSKELKRLGPVMIVSIMQNVPLEVITDCIAVGIHVGLEMQKEAMND